MGAVTASASEPTLAAIKLAWWRESLEKLDNAPPPAEPRLQAAARELLPRGLTGADLAELEKSWALLLQANEAFERSAALRGRTLFALAARLLGVPMDDCLEEASRDFAVADLGRRRIGPVSRGSVPATPSAPRAARPLTALAALARRDLRSSGPPFEPEATPGRAWALIWHRVTGR